MSQKLSLLLIILFTITNKISADTIEFDVSQYPFSYHGSYLSVMLEKNPNDNKEGLYIRDVSGQYMWKWKGVFKLEMLKDNMVVPMKVIGTPSKLIAKSEEGIVELCFEKPDVIRIKGNGSGFRLTQTIATWSGATYPINYEKTLWHCKMWGPHFVAAITKGQHQAKVTSSYVNEPVTDDPLFVLDVIPESDEGFELAIEQVKDTWDGKKYTKPFEQCVKDAENHFKKFEKNIPTTPSRYDKIRKLGAYVKWSSVVNPRTAIKRACMYQSKNYMTAIWAWDNCFGAMAVCNDIDFAIDQLLVLFDHQTKLGALPDFLTDMYPMYAAFKPQIYGLTMQKIKDLSNKKLTSKDIEKIYEPISKLTSFWLNYMDNNNNGIPQYNNSNDCCDNSPIFLPGYPLESPDLSTHLIIQMDWLSDAAAQLRKNEESKSWKENADKLTQLLIDSLWNGEMFEAKHSFTGETCGDCISFISYIPIMLGKRLPNDILSKMLDDLKNGGIVTDFGPASEHPQSPYFIDDGYWRGPVWAPHYLFLVEGLKRSGEQKWAKELAENFANMCKTSGFPENFSSLDGRPLRDTGYSWTVDVFFALAHEYLD